MKLADSPKPTFKTVVQSAEPQDVPNAEEVQNIVPLAGLTDDEFAELANSILVCIPHAGSEGINTGIANHFGMWGRIGLRLATMKDPTGGFLEIMRGNMVNFFLELAWKIPELRYLVMIDNDESIPWDAPLRLAQHGKPIVSGVVCSYSPERGIFACFTAKDENGIPRFPSYRDTKFLPAEGLIEVHQAGTGLLCIRRDVLETLRDNNDEPFMFPEELRRECIKAGQVRKGEDIVFCERARRYGFDVWVDLSVHATHYKEIPIGWPQDCIDDSLNAIDWKPSAFDYKGVI